MWCAFFFFIQIIKCYVLVMHVLCCNSFVYDLFIRYLFRWVYWCVIDMVVNNGLWCLGIGIEMSSKEKSKYDSNESIRSIAYLQIKNLVAWNNINVFVIGKMNMWKWWIIDDEINVVKKLKRKPNSEVMKKNNFRIDIRFGREKEILTKKNWQEKKNTYE